MKRSITNARRCTPLALALLAAPVAAQGPEPETVPLEFVRTLATGPFGGDARPEVRVGRLPDDLARLLTPPADARVVGSLIQRSHTLSALAVPGDPAAVRDDWTARLLDGGWTRFQPQEPPRGGFASPPRSDGLQFCMGDSITLNLAVSPNAHGGSYVHVMHPTARMYSICRTQEDATRWNTESPIPSLAPPAGAVAQRTGSGGSGDEWDAHARLRTDMGPGPLVDHYGAQLRDHGWTPLERTAGERVAVETYRLSGPGGGTWHAVLTASVPTGGSERLLAMRLTRVMDTARRSQRVGTGERYMVAVVQTDRLGPDGVRFEVIRRPDFRPHDVILLHEGATAADLSRAVWTVLIAHRVEPTAPSEENRIRIRIREKEPRSGVLKHLPWTDRVMTDLQNAGNMEVDGIGDVKALMIFLPHEAEVRSASPPVPVSHRAGEASREEAPSTGHVDMTAFAGLGAGPTPSGTWGVGAELPLAEMLGLKAEYSRWGSGIGAACVAMWPRSYKCSVGGWAALAGLALAGSGLGDIRPFAEVLGGRYSRDQHGKRFGSMALAVGAGADIAVGRSLSLRAGARYMRPFDDAYDELMGEPLSYTLGTVGLRYRIGW